MKGKGAPVDLVVEVLRRLDAAGVLQEMVLVGSWCVHFYKDYFEGAALSAIRTRDMDFLIPSPPKFKSEVPIAGLLKDLGFIPDIHADGSVSLIHPELIIDFLVPEHGRGSDAPYLVKSLGVKAQRLRFMEMLSEDAIRVRARGLDLAMPHPINYAFHKLLISGRRVSGGKSAKDRLQAVEVLREVAAQGSWGAARLKFGKLPVRWRKVVLKELETAEAADLAVMLTSEVSWKPRS